MHSRLNSIRLYILNYLPMLWLQLAPVKPGRHSQKYEFTRSSHVPLLRHGLLKHSLMSENKWQSQVESFVHQKPRYTELSVCDHFCIFYTHIMS